MEQMHKPELEEQVLQKIISEDRKVEMQQELGLVWMVFQIEGTLDIQEEEQALEILEVALTV